MDEKNKHIDLNLLTRYLAGEITEQEREDVEKWISASPDNRKEYEKLARTWDSLGAIEPGHEINIEKEWRYHQKLIGSKIGKTRVLTLQNFLRVAAAIIILFGTGLLLRYQLTTESLRTQHAETLQKLLPDGTSVTLNAGSKLRYARNFLNEERRVVLQGEAYFEVKRDSTRPFIITLGEAEIKVLGTAFNVKAYKNSGKIEVTVTEGRVSLYEKNQELKQVIAGKGEKAEYLRTEKLVKKVENKNRNFLAWKTRILEFEDDRLSDVVEILEQVYHRQIRLKNEKIGACRLNTRFEGKDLNMVLEVISSTLELSIVKEKDIIYLDGQGCE
jgi:transmembrane sensor